MRKKKKASKRVYVGLSADGLKTLAKLSKLLFRELGLLEKKLLKKAK